MRRPVPSLYILLEQLTLFLNAGGRRDGTSCIWLTSEEAINEQFYTGGSCAIAGVLKTECMHTHRHYVIIVLFLINV